MHNSRHPSSKIWGPLTTTEISRQEAFWIKRAQKEGMSDPKFKEDRAQLNLVNNCDEILVCKGRLVGEKQSSFSTDTADTESDEDISVPPHRVPMKEYNLRTEPKFIVFFSQLLTLFQICRMCKSDRTLVEVNSHGTMAEVKTTCVNPDCGERTTWFSQPYFPGTKIAAGKVVPINLSSLEEVPGCIGGESKRIQRNSHCWGWTT
ncbi:Hypothetical predicted protein [Paramuricea clavata]|uniref:Uncharacterized protein n=1 Tax=Paramuricea clavata TaxID=317549 RepID=A0A7D9JXK2_PARCT|nr:Hypothetical predicted protein [Paramuricea clavata]